MMAVYLDGLGMESTSTEQGQGELFSMCRRLSYQLIRITLFMWAYARDYIIYLM